ncbi:hypothetical protein OJ252_3444, partial [Cryptosporidium canis]
ALCRIYQSQQDIDLAYRLDVLQEITELWSLRVAECVTMYTIHEGCNNSISGSTRLNDYEIPNRHTWDGGH